MLQEEWATVWTVNWLSKPTYMHLQILKTRYTWTEHGTLLLITTYFFKRLTPRNCNVELCFDIFRALEEVKSWVWPGLKCHNHILQTYARHREAAHGTVRKPTAPWGSPRHREGEVKNYNRKLLISWKCYGLGFPGCWWYPDCRLSAKGTNGQRY